MDDALEDNDSFGEATVMPPYSYMGLQICSMDSDFFSVMLEAGEILDVTILFAHADGDLDMTLYDPSQNCIAESESETGNEMITYEALVSGTYYLEVYGYQGAENVCDLQANAGGTTYYSYLPVMPR